MAVNPENVDLTHVESVTDIKPPPTLALSEHEHHIGPIGDLSKRWLLMLLEETSEAEPAGTRVFDRLGVPYAHATWRDFDVYWADDEDAFIEALRRWHEAQQTG